MNKSFLLGLIVVAVVALVVFNQPANVNAPTESSGTSDEVMIRVINPQPNAVVSNPLVVQGEARGMWFFEADAPLIVTNEAGQVIGQSFIQAQGDWMTESFVPFQGVVELQDEATQGGVLILQRANPSGLPEHEAAVEIPIQFE